MPSREEELGRVQFEAMAAGVPLVVFETIGSKNLLSKKQKKLMIKQGDVNRFTRSITFALKNKKKLKKEGLKQLHGHSLFNAKEEFVQIIKNI